MSIQAVFWILVVLGVIELFAIYMVSYALREYLKSDLFKKRLKRKEKRDKGNVGKLTAIALIFSLILPQVGWATGFTAEPAQPSFFSNITETGLWIVLTCDIVLLLIFLYLKNMLGVFLNIDKTEEELLARKKRKQANVMKWLTDAVPVEQEETVATDHEYDGIRELDNNLPPWWKYGFYLSILIAVVYLLNYHVFKTGDLQIAEYEKEMEQAELDIQTYLKKQAMNVDETSVTFFTDMDNIKKGKNMFIKYCKVCHGEYGEGGVGPNLTDEYWLYGGGAKNIFKTVKYGAKNGMKSWKDEFNPVQMQQVVSFIKTLEGTNPENAKEPQGELYVEESDDEI